MTIALLINLVLWTPRLIDRYDGTSPGFWIVAVIAIAATTIVTYAAYLVITRIGNFVESLAESLLKRIPRGGAKGILVLGMVSILLFSTVAEANPRNRGIRESLRRAAQAFGAGYMADKAIDAFGMAVTDPLREVHDAIVFR